MTLILRASRLPDDIRGIYGPNQDRLGRRQLLLAPDAAKSFMNAYRASNDSLVVSDMWRTAESSLAAVRAGRGAQPPGYSGHNFGVSIDLAVDQTKQRMGIPYQQLLVYMANFGWHCFRRDGQRGSEDWHWNYLDSSEASELPTLPAGQWARAAEHAIQDRYSGQFALNPSEVQAALVKLRMYQGDVDGVIGPRSQEGVYTFARAWQVPPDHRDARFQRTLAYLAADVEEQPLA